MKQSKRQIVVEAMKKAVQNGQEIINMMDVDPNAVRTYISQTKHNYPDVNFSTSVHGGFITIKTLAYIEPTKKEITKAQLSSLMDKIYRVIDDHFTVTEDAPEQVSTDWQTDNELLNDGDHQFNPDDELV